MRNYVILIATILCFGIGNISAQEKTKSASKTNSVKTGRIESLLQSKNFEFIANKVFPMSAAPRNIAGSSYSVEFSPEMIVSNMPFFGRAYSGVIAGRDSGMNFKGSPAEYRIERNKKGLELFAKVKTDEGVYTLSLSVSDSGFASLTISSSNRETMSYRGEIK